MVAEMLAMGFICMSCFLLGAKVGQTVSKGETIETPSISVNPLEAHRKREAKREALAEQERFETIMQNIENYDGTGNNQKDVPGR